MSVKPLRYYREKYIRNQPSAFCIGCGDGTILNCFVRAIDDLEIPTEKVLCVSGARARILVNNLSYAMTGGQLAPTTHHGERTVTSPYGNPESPFDTVKLVREVERIVCGRAEVVSVAKIGGVLPSVDEIYQAIRRVA